MRISNKFKRDGFGYIEDRRPAANMDPYLAMTRIAETIVRELVDKAPEGWTPPVFAPLHKARSACFVIQYFSADL